MLACFATLAVAQSQPLKPSEVTETGIAEALSPPDAASSDTGLRSRGFRPTVQPQPASAAVLITFVTNSAELTHESKAALDVIARAMRSEKLEAKSFVVEGHADARGDPDGNQQLSRARADAVVAYLTAKHAIARERLVALGKGATEPLNKVQTDAPENRRVTFVTRNN